MSGIRSRTAQSGRIVRETAKTALLALPVLALAIGVSVGVFVAWDAWINGVSAVTDTGMSYGWIGVLALWIASGLHVLIIGALVAVREVSND